MDSEPVVGPTLRRTYFFNSKAVSQRSGACKQHRVACTRRSGGRAMSTLPRPSSPTQPFHVITTITVTISISYLFYLLRVRVTPLTGYYYAALNVWSTSSTATAIPFINPRVINTHYLTTSNYQIHSYAFSLRIRTHLCEYSIMYICITHTHLYIACARACVDEQSKLNK